MAGLRDAATTLLVRDGVTSLEVFSGNIAPRDGPEAGRVGAGVPSTALKLVPPGKPYSCWRRTIHLLSGGLWKVELLVVESGP